MDKQIRNRSAMHPSRLSSRLVAIFAAGAFLLALGAFFAFSQPANPKAAIEVFGAPSLKVDKDEVDLGEVKLGQIVQASFQITNVGDQALQFTSLPYIEVKEGC